MKEENKKNHIQKPIHLTFLANSGYEIDSENYNNKNHTKKYK